MQEAHVAKREKEDALYRLEQVRIFCANITTIHTMCLYIHCFMLINFQRYERRMRKCERACRKPYKSKPITSTWNKLVVSHALTIFKIMCSLLKHYPHRITSPYAFPWNLRSGYESSRRSWSTYYSDRTPPRSRAIPAASFRSTAFLLFLTKVLVPDTLVRQFTTELMFLRHRWLRNTRSGKSTSPYFCTDIYWPISRQFLF